MTEGMRWKFSLARRMLFDNGGLEEIFRHVRNLVVATLVIAAGMHAVENGRSLDIKGLPNTAVAGYIVSTIGVVLFLLNLAEPAQAVEAASASGAADPAVGDLCLRHPPGDTAGAGSAHVDPLRGHSLHGWGVSRRMPPADIAVDHAALATWYSLIATILIAG